MWGPKAKGRRRTGALRTEMKDGRMDGGRSGTSINPRHGTVIYNLIPMVYVTLQYMHKEHCRPDEKCPPCQA